MGLRGRERALSSPFAETLQRSTPQPVAAGFMNSHRPLNIAHRGASAVAPENTLVAFERARALGADGVELDVRLSADGVPVVIHNATVDATTDGSGQVAEMTVAQLERLDAGAWFGPSYAGTRIPTLEETLLSLGEKLLFNIELKGHSPVGRGLVRAVVDLVEGLQLVDRILISSFNPLHLHRLQKIAPRIQTGLLYVWRFFPGVAQLVSPEPYAALHPALSVLNKKHLDWIRRHDYRVHVWTVDDPGSMRRLISWGVDAIITNMPDRLHRLLESTDEGGHVAFGSESAGPPL